ncbi:MAG: hypothetical protein PHY40_03560 [Patescibacteria group bacterium]|nr:hypothetical protein [Patescibacteria group bacterium]
MVKKVKAETMKSLLEIYGESCKERIARGVEQAACFWKKKDGTDKEFKKFCEENFLDFSDKEVLQKILQKAEEYWEAVNGCFTKMMLGLLKNIHLETGEITQLDKLFSQFSPMAHLEEDLFENKIAFFFLLNFPSFSLEEKEKFGKSWSRQEWALASIGDMFSSRVPAELYQKINKAMVEAEEYISKYNISLANLTGGKDNDEPCFPKSEKKLQSHWGLRDEIKELYGEEQGGLKKQSALFKVMERIIKQEIPQEVINNSSKDFSWNPFTNETKGISSTPEPDERYSKWLSVFKSISKADRYAFGHSNYIDVNFEKQMKISEKEITDLLIELLSSSQFKSVGKLISKRLKRPLKPWDIWYDGFGVTESSEILDKVVVEKYPNLETLKKSVPEILMKLGFTKEVASYLADRIEIEPARGCGHAIGAEMKSEKSRLRFRMTGGKINSNEFNVFMHELGHNVEQNFTLQKMDSYFLRGVPNTAFTEAFAFVFQSRDREILGLKPSSNLKDEKTLSNFWSACEIAGVALVDIGVWRWLYLNSETTPKEMKGAVVKITKDVWNTYFAKVFGVEDEVALGIYSHAISFPLYLPNYPLGKIIAFQIEKYMENKNLGAEMERMCGAGNISPQFWMKNAVGEKISCQPMLEAVDEILKKIG